ncbi:acyl carrier protein [Streptomyces sp. NPDC012693]|jgi:acyl carrier protein|uniref:acyl carrier protein n=1 Tax=unclassified Streptomyces TaxID=2593676 RepID=UPI000B160D08|nr:MULTISPECIES: acyl carrier protein [unclassified Streptomyces]
MSDVIDRTAISTFVTDALIELGVDRSDIVPDAALDDLEVDSLDMVELSQSIKRDLGIPVKPKDFDDVETFGQLLNVCCTRAGIE